MKGKKGFSGSPKKAMSSGPIKHNGGGVSQSSIPRTGYPPGGRNHATRYDQSTDCHSIDKKG
jgi:hypothetical protein